MSAYLVGLTGGIGSGKTTVAHLFAEREIAVVDTDVIAHQLTGPDGEAMPSIIAKFGNEVVENSGALNRVAMRRLVFADPSLRQNLEAILHPLIASKTLQACQEAVSPYVIVAVPLLLEAKGWKEGFDRVLVVDCDEATQIKRVMARSGLREDEVRAILAAQISRAERLAAADDIVLNNSELSELISRVEELHSIYLGLAQKKLEVKC